MSVSPENIAIAKYIDRAFGGTFTVRKFRHDTEDFSVDLLRSDDRPYDGITSFSTIGLSDFPMYEDGVEFRTRLEIAGACATAAEWFPNILASASFCIMRTGRLVSPGRVMPGYVREYYPETTVPHLYFTTPFLWDDEPLASFDCGTKLVSWLLAMPISAREHEYLLSHGNNALEDLFEEHQIDIFDLARQSVV